MKRALGILIDEKYRLNQMLIELNKIEDCSDKLIELIEEIRTDMCGIDDVLEAIDEYKKKYY